MAHKVIGAVAVVKLAGGGERYLYKGALLPDGVYDEESVKHCVSVGALVEVEEPESEPDEGPYKGVSVKDLKAEIAKRNEGRADDKKIVPAEPGNQAELVAALIADDK